MMRYWQRILEGHPPNQLVDISWQRFADKLPRALPQFRINTLFYVIVSERRGTITSLSLVVLLTDIVRDRRANCLVQYRCRSWALHDFPFLV